VCIFFIVFLGYGIFGLGVCFCLLGMVDVGVLLGVVVFLVLILRGFLCRLLRMLLLSFLVIVVLLLLGCCGCWLVMVVMLCISGCVSVGMMCLLLILMLSRLRVICVI